MSGIILFPGVTVVDYFASDLTVSGVWTFTTNPIMKYRARIAAYTLTAQDYLVNCTSGTFAITLPTAASIAGRTYKVKNSGTGAITINTTSSQTVDGQASGYWQLSQWDSMEVMSDGANWIIN